MRLTRPDITGTLRSVVDGPVLASGNPGYDEARTPFFSHRTGHPIAVVRPRHSGDVAATIRVAVGSETPLHVRSGGHTWHSTGDGLLLDLGSLTGLDVDVAQRTAWASSGLTAGALTRELGHYQLAVGLGDTGSTGIGGTTLGGGIGFLARRHGLTIDNVLAVEMVTADGSIRTVDADRDPDLFWAIRGGGGNFGVVTRFHYRLASLPTVYGGLLMLPATPRTIAELASACAEAEPGLSVIANITAAPPLRGVVLDTPVVMARICHAEPDRAEAAVGGLRDIAPPVVDQLGFTSYPKLLEDETPDRGMRPALQTRFLRQFDESTAAVVLDRLAAARSWLRLVQFRVLGGAVAAVRADETAYAHRGAPILATILHGDEQDPVFADRWTRRVAADLDQGVAGAYVNFLGPGDASRADLAYPGSTLRRLRQIKAAHDPQNVFRHNINITPEGADV
jgi:hypothetical protein